MKFLIVVETQPTERMRRHFLNLIQQLGMKQEDITLLPLLGDELPAGKNHLVTSEQLARHIPRLHEALQSIEADVTLPLGGNALYAMTGLRWPIQNVAGYIITSKYFKPVVWRENIQIGTYKTTNKAKGYSKGDPRYALKAVPHTPVLPAGCRCVIPGIPIETAVKLRFKNATQFSAPFKNALAIARGQRPLDEVFTWSDTPDFPTPSELVGGVAYDLETPIDSDMIERGSVSWQGHTYTFKWDGTAKENLQKAINAGSIRIAHNQQFDIPILKKHGVEVPEPTFDTMLAAALLEPDLPKGLVSVAPLYLLVEPWKHISSERGFADPYYSAKDAFVEYHLFRALQNTLIATGQYDLFMNRIMPSVPVLMDMKERGVRVDLNRAAVWAGELQLKSWNLTQEWMKMFPLVNPHSHAQVRKLLYKDLKYPTQYTGGDGVSTNSMALRRILESEPKSAPVVELLLELRDTHKLLSTYSVDGEGQPYVHPSYIPVGKDQNKGQPGKGVAATGRLACSNPNFQNQPLEARRLYIPDFEDFYFVELDWSQAELRVAAALSGDKAMQTALEGDIHAVTMELLGCERRVAKAVLYGAAYGAGPRKTKDILNEAGVDIDEKATRALQENLARAYPAWWAWRNYIAAQAAADKKLRNPFGRLRRFPGGHHDTTAALDFLPQSIVADMGWTLYRPVWDEARRLGGRLTTVVHDSFLIQLPKGTGFDTIKALLEQEFPEVAPGFTIPADAKVGPSWGELEKA